jgi:Transposase protein
VSDLAEIMIAITNHVIVPIAYKKVLIIYIVIKKIQSVVHDVTNNKNVVLHNSRRREQSLKARADSLLNVVKHLRLLSTETETLISLYDNMPVRLFDHRQGTPFSDEQKHFVTTMHFYSPAAYEFLRKQFQTLPSPRTICSWLPSYDGRPGLTEQSFETISNAINGSQGWQYKLCCLHMDEMEIKKHLDYDKRRKKMFDWKWAHRR